MSSTETFNSYFTNVPYKLNHKWAPYIIPSTLLNICKIIENIFETKLEYNIVDKICWGSSYYYDPMEATTKQKMI